MLATRLIVLRHGETAWNVDTRLQGHTDIALNPTGHWQAQRLAEALADETLAAVVCSDLQRALVTAQHVAQPHGLMPAIDPGLRERGFGILEGCTWAEVEERHPEAAQQWRRRIPHWAPPQGESLADLQARIQRTVNTWAQQYVGQQVALVAHGGVLDVLHRWATGLALDAPRSWTLPNAAINRLLWTPDGMTLVGWGDVRHLEPTPHAPVTSAA